MSTKESSVYFWNTGDVGRMAGDCGNHWFEPASLRFFCSRVSSAVYGGRYFVSSEQGGRDIWGGERRYSVREVTYLDGHMTIDTVGEFGEYDTGAQAHGAAKRLGKLQDVGDPHHQAHLARVAASYARQMAQEAELVVYSDYFRDRQAAGL